MLAGRRPAVTTVLATAAALAGAVGIASALTPEFASRFDLVEGILPPGIPETARVLALAFGILLIWLSRSLARRKQRAWQLSVVLVAALAGTHLAKGLDFEEALISFIVLAALWRYRREFTAKGDPKTIRPLLQVLAALAALGAVSLLQVWEHTGDAETSVERAVAVLAAALGARALYLWLRPVAQRVRQSGHDREQAARLVQEYGGDSLAFFALRRDKSYFFSASRRSFLAYRVVGGCALVSGDPIGDERELAELLAGFRRVAQARAWRVGVLGVRQELLPVYRALGFRAIYLGDEAVVKPAEFSLEGRRIRKVRQSVSRLERSGYNVRVLRAAEADSALRAELGRVSCEWRGRWPERGFAMTMDTLFAHPETVIAFAEDERGRVGGFVHLVPVPATGGYSLASMRRAPGTPNGLMEYVIVRTIDWAREAEVPQLSLNFAVFGDVLRAGSDASRPRRVLRAVLRPLDRVFQLERLLSFNGKFFPEWCPRYLCFERLSDFPAIGLAYLHAESLLTPPVPWGSRTTDLAAR